MAGKELIWVVDDDPAIRELLSFIVSEAGYIVEAFASGAEVLAHSGQQPAAVLLDLMMPEVDGVEVLKELKRRHPSLPVIILTADDDISRAVEVTKLGAYDYLVKPADQERLLTTLNRALSHGNLRPSSGGARRSLPSAQHHRLIVGHAKGLRSDREGARVRDHGVHFG
jgi:DNA-binding NtrC family response regulator